MFVMRRCALTTHCVRKDGLVVPVLVSVWVVPVLCAADPSSGLRTHLLSSLCPVPEGVVNLGTWC
jgi:hypothetical protein